MSRPDSILGVIAHLDHESKALRDVGDNDGAGGHEDAAGRSPVGRVQGGHAESDRRRRPRPAWRLGYRYRLSVKSLPGRPDLVFRRLHRVIFVHGCFWHRHPDVPVEVDAAKDKALIDAFSAAVAAAMAGTP